MTKLTLVPPSVGEEDKNAEPKVGTAFKAVETWANGEIDGTTNIKSEGILEANLSKALQEKLTSKVGLTVEKKNESFTGESEKFYLQEKGASTTTFPASTLNRFMGVFNAVVGGADIKIKTTAGIFVCDFTEGNELTLSSNQHLVFVADGTNWRQFSGEPKQTSTWSARVGQLVNTLVTPSTTRPSEVVLTIPALSKVLGIIVEGKEIATAAEEAQIISFRVNAGQTWEAKGEAGKTVQYSKLIL